MLQQTGLHGMNIFFLKKEKEKCTENKQRE